MPEITPAPINGSQRHPIIKELLKARGWSEDYQKEFFDNNLRQLPLLTDLIDLKKASIRLIQAIKSNEKIGIYGDYDVDGTTSCALLYHFFKLFGVDVELIQPSRFIQGYGLHSPSVEEAHKEGIKILVTVDCGITSSEAADTANALGMTLIITDHHKDGAPEMPNAFAIINPNRRDEDLESPLVHLAGVGVGFALALQMKNDWEKLEETTLPSLYPLLQFVAVGTICDMAHLNPMNAKLVRHGLKQLPKTEYPGLKSFLSREEQALAFLPSEKLSFSIGPMINSKGRLDHPERALSLLTTDQSDTAQDHFRHLELCNGERKKIQAQVFEAAKNQIISTLDHREHLMSIAYEPDWHEGVIGIVASKLVETFKVPAAVFSNASDEGIIKASIRSASELNIYDCLHQCSDLFIKFGGHKAAAGLSMKKELLPAFRQKMGELLSEIPAITRVEQEYFDLEMSSQFLDASLVREMEQLEPFGMGNKKPVFKFTDLELQSFDILKDVHVRWTFKKAGGQGPTFKGISFFFMQKFNTLKPNEIMQAVREGQSISVFGSPTINRFKGNAYLQLMVDNIKV